MPIPDIWEMLTGSLKPSDEDDIPECDYDIDCIPLYQAIEKQEWEHVRDFLVTGKWHNNFFQSTFLPFQFLLPSGCGFSKRLFSILYPVSCDIHIPPNPPRHTIPITWYGTVRVSLQNATIRTTLLSSPILHPAYVLR